MDSYKFGGSKVKRIYSDILQKISLGFCKLKTIHLWVTRKINWISVDMKRRAEKMMDESKPITIHITRIVPLDKWSARIEFTINRKEKFCLHMYTPTGDYVEIFTQYKKGNEIEIKDSYYHMISQLRNEWKKMY